MRHFLLFEDAHKLVLPEIEKLGIDTERKWQYAKKYNYNRPNGVPYNPSLTYREKGWISWGHWLGTNNIRGCLRKYKVNDDFFKIWTQDMAYILGFWYADGNMRMRIKGNSNTYLFSICQHTRDKYLLENMLAKMDSDSLIYSPTTRRNLSTFEINSKKMFNDLESLGGMPDKSKKIRLPAIPDQYFPYYIRGLFDGDGSITIHKVKKRTTKIYEYRNSFICSGNMLFLEDLKTALSNFSIRGIIYSNGNKDGECFKLCFGVNQTKNLGRFMYENKSEDLCLVRKKQKFIKDGKFIWKQEA